MGAIKKLMNCKFYIIGQVLNTDESQVQFIGHRIIWSWIIRVYQNGLFFKCTIRI